MDRSSTLLSLTLSLIVFTVGASGQLARNIPPPRADHHQHVFSPDVAKLQGVTTITARDVIADLDAAGIERAVLLSTAYAWGRPGREPQNEYEMVKATNDWVGEQAALYPKRLVGFCGFNPLKDYAVAEIERCSRIPALLRGIKFHVGNSDVQMENPRHLEKLKAVFRAANAKRMSMVIHMRASFSLNRPYGAEQARAFIEHLLPLAPDITIQIAHLGSSGPGYDDPKVDAFMDALVAGVQDPQVKNRRNVWFDLTTIVHPTNTPERSAVVWRRIRQIGPDRILYGSDAPFGSNQRPKDAWAEIAKLGLTEKELRSIAGNRAPYMR
ncbi:MAG TPA: amidohydrolase family protein [Pyrinomonadaceae bacterium]|nr:amidohydrolase family protein [Pyrinomonadaceae bacterium]